MSNQNPTDCNINPVKAGGIVAVNLLAGSILGMAVMVGYDVIATDVLHNNPHRSSVDALFRIPFLGLLGGLVALFGYCLIAAVSAVFWTWLLVRRTGHLPFWSSMAMIPVYWALIALQYSLLPDFDWYADLPEQAAKIGGFVVATRMTLMMMPILIFSWWQLKRRRASTR